METFRQQQDLGGNLAQRPLEQFGGLVDPDGLALDHVRQGGGGHFALR
jgi:hypothetical protein